MAKALTIDETLEKINEIILQMENGNQSLEEALSSYE
ncbi:MAG: exodeoxyribonuclease VII small subunit, partial [Lachnospiraceae bacterium]